MKSGGIKLVFIGTKHYRISICIILLPVTVVPLEYNIGATAMLYGASPG
jgi:hypothetical protein